MFKDYSKIHPIDIKKGLRITYLMNFLQYNETEMKDLLNLFNLSYDDKEIDSSHLEEIFDYLGYPYISYNRLSLTMPGKEHKRNPIVSLIGHIDHGKTSLLDYIKKTNMAHKEFAGITQQIGSYTAYHEGHRITFLDTPGHKAFSDIRSLTSTVADITILVIALDSGIQAQTLECIQYIKEKNLEIIIAFTKCDRDSIGEDKIEKQLIREGIYLEKYNGNVPAVRVSSKTGEGVKDLLDIIILKADLLDLRCRQVGYAEGAILESKFNESLGYVNTILVKEGCLKVKDLVFCEGKYGLVKTITNEQKVSIKYVLPSEPVEISGIGFIQEPGAMFYVIHNTNVMRSLLDTYSKIYPTENHAVEKSSQLSDISLLQQILKSKHNHKFIMRADTRGALEALKKEISMLDMSYDILQAGIGHINESDMDFASNTQAIILAFNSQLRRVNQAKYPNVKVIAGKTIYKISEELFDYLNVKDIKEEQILLGKGAVIQSFTFKEKKIAGCKVDSGKFVNNSKVKIYRAGEEIFQGTISSIQIEKNTAQEALKNTECGLWIQHYQPIIGDTIEVYKQVFNS